YGVLQIALILGVVGGSLVASRFSARRTTVALAGSLWVFAATTAAVGVSTASLLATASIFLSGVGNAGYAVTNLSALMRAATDRNRGTVMAARLAATQLGSVVGLGLGAAVTTLAGPKTTFLVAAGLLCALAEGY